MCEKHYRRWKRHRRFHMGKRLDVPRVAALYLCGFTTVELAKVYNVHRCSITRALQRAGVTQRHEGKTALDLERIAEVASTVART